MKHALVVRFRFEDEELMAKYIEVCKAVLIPCLRAQTNQDFTLILTAKPEHQDLLRSELDFPIQFADEKDALLFDKLEESNGEFFQLEDFNIQTRHDCDDWMAPNYIEAIQNMYHELKDEFDSFLIQSQPVKWMYHENAEIALKPYTPQRCSMHLTLCQREVKHHIYERKHAEMGKLVGFNVFTLSGTFTKWVIHGDNITVKRQEEARKKQNG